MQMRHGILRPHSNSSGISLFRIRPVRKLCVERPQFILVFHGSRIARHRFLHPGNRRLYLPGSRKRAPIRSKCGRSKFLLSIPRRSLKLLKQQHSFCRLPALLIGHSQVQLRARIPRLNRQRPLQFVNALVEPPQPHQHRSQRTVPLRNSRLQPNHFLKIVLRGVQVVVRHRIRARSVIGIRLLQTGRRLLRINPMHPARACAHKPTQRH